MEPFFEIVWPGQDRHVKAFARHTETPDLLWFEIRVGGRAALVGAMVPDQLIKFLPTLKSTGA